MSSTADTLGADIFSTVDAIVTEWTADLHLPTTRVVTTAQASIGYVDFDVIDSVHEAPVSALRERAGGLR